MMRTSGGPLDSGSEGSRQRFVTVLGAHAPSQSKDVGQVARLQPPTILMRLVQHFRVCWKVVPETSLLGADRHQIGFGLELCGMHDPAEECVGRTCIHCHNVLASLHVIADWILSREKRALMPEAEVHFPCPAYPRARQEPWGIRFAIRVTHRRASDEVAQERLAQWLRELEASLNELGASELRTEATARPAGLGGSNGREK